MEQTFGPNLGIGEEVNFDNVRHWISEVLEDKVEFQCFLAYHAGDFSGLASIEGMLIIKNPTAISVQGLTDYLNVPNSLVKSLKITTTS